MRKMVLAAGVATLVLAGCTSEGSQDTIRSTAKGGLIGGGVGLVVGALDGRPVRGAAHGVAIGAAAGALTSVADQLFNPGPADYGEGYGTGYNTNDYDTGSYPPQNQAGYGGGYAGGYDQNSVSYQIQGSAVAVSPVPGYEIDPATGYRRPIGYRSSGY
ncbi:MAG: hypothetical protein OEN23_07030 [Paracoccaceae bacterium]|nr:hypothetical protein [Paracoccaceae bacterium]